MKKIFLLLSIIVMTAWIVGFFLLKTSSSIHVLLALSIVLYIRSLLQINTSVTQKYYESEGQMK